MDSIYVISFRQCVIRELAANASRVVDADLDYKHERMRKNPFVFLRARRSFRWAKRFEKLCPELKDAPRVLFVGDTHTENFGTWRDFEGRLVWGVNEFDEATIIPYPFDLVRLECFVSTQPPYGTLMPQSGRRHSVL